MLPICKKLKVDNTIIAQNNYKWRHKNLHVVHRKSYLAALEKLKRGSHWEVIKPSWVT